MSFYFYFFTSNSSFRVLGPLVGSSSFVEPFVAEVFHEDLGTMFSLPMLVNPHMTFLMFLLCYT
jgi:hypothetical protein